jgi:hypothetical protein
LELIERTVKELMDKKNEKILFELSKFTFKMGLDPETTKFDRKVFPDRVEYFHKDTHVLTVSGVKIVGSSASLDIRVEYSI